jgi:hypothetical protein
MNRVGMQSPIKMLREQLLTFYGWLLPKSRQTRRTRLYQYKDFCLFSLSVAAFILFSASLEGMLLLDLTELKKMGSLAQ